MLNSLPFEVDVAVIGAGSAGLPAFRAAREHTDRVILIERGPHGTTCARVGCMPSKLLIAAAEAAHGMEIAPGFGIHPGSIKIDGEAVMERVRRERDRFVGFVLDGTGWTGSTRNKRFLDRPDLLRIPGWKSGTARYAQAVW